MLSYLVSQKMGISKTDDNFRYVSIVLSTTLIIAAALTFFLSFNIYTGRYPLLIVAQSIGMLLSYLALFLLLKKRRVRTAAFILLIVVMGLCFLTMMLVNNRSYSLALVLLCPILSIFFAGIRLGMLFNTVYFVGYLWLCISHFDVWKPASFGPIGLIQLGIVFAVISGITYFYESSRLRIQSALESSNQKLAEIAFKDPLTGLYNRRYLEDAVLEANHFGYFALVDVDDFKRINDVFGHHTGDMVLQHLAQMIDASFDSDKVLVTRWGGRGIRALIP